MFYVLELLFTASQRRLPVSGQLGFLRRAWSPWSLCWRLWACPPTTSRSSLPWTGSCEYAWMAIQRAVARPPSVTPGHQAAWPTCQKGSTKRGSVPVPVIKLPSLLSPCPYLETQPRRQVCAKCAYTLISPWGTAGKYTSHSIKPFSDWETGRLQSQHKSARHFLNCTTHPHGGQSRTTGLTRWLRPSSLCFPFQWRNAVQMFPSEPSRERGGHAVGRVLASLSRIDCGSGESSKKGTFHPLRP